MRVGIGFGNDTDPYELGRQVATQAMEQGQVAEPDLVLAFVNKSLDAEAFQRGLRAAVGAGVPIVGGSAIGIITNDAVSYTGSPAGVAVLSLGAGTMRHAAAAGVDRDEFAAGQDLGRRLSGSPDARLLLLLYDSVKTPAGPSSPPEMNASPPLIAGVEAALQPGVPIVGAGLLGDQSFSTTVRYSGHSIDQQVVVGVLLGGSIEPYVAITHGCALKDGLYHTITRMDGPVIAEIDGRPATDVIDDAYGDRHWRGQLPVRRLTIGVNHGDRFGDFQEDRIVNRLIVGEAPGGGGLVLFEPDLGVGTEFQFLLRDGQTMMDSARRNATALVERIRAAGHTPRFALYIDCAGRCAAISDTLVEEATEIQAVMNAHGIPLFGFYSGVEIAPLLGRSRGLDWTGVLLILAEA